MRGLKIGGVLLAIVMFAGLGRAVVPGRGETPAWGDIAGGPCR